MESRGAISSTLPKKELNSMNISFQQIGKGMKPLKALLLQNREIVHPQHFAWALTDEDGDLADGDGESESTDGLSAG